MRTQFPRFQDEYTIILEAAKRKDPPTVTGECVRPCSDGAVYLS